MCVTEWLYVYLVVGRKVNREVMSTVDCGVRGRAAAAAAYRGYQRT